LTAPELLKYETFLNEFNDIKNGGTASSSSSSSSEILVDNDYELTVTKLGGKICRRCHRGVQKREGCNHMTCLCSHQFCYSCGANWTPRRECSCSLFTEAEVNRMVDEVAPLAHGRERLNLVNIYQHHDQHVHRWRRIPINQTVDRRLKRCRTCVWVCNMWYHQCITCLEIRCTRCTRNRD
jgi:hypothetical protein